MRKLLIALLLVIGSLANTSAGATASALVFAAASLKEALDEQAAQFRSGPKIVVSYGASSILAKQIENGAPVALFISADAGWMDYLAARGLIDARSRTDLLGNRLALVAPAENRIKIDLAPRFPLTTLLDGGRLAMGDPDHVPAGRYAKAALETLGVWNNVADRTARAANVRAALALVARGEAPLGIVYRTDALAEKKVRIVAEFPAASHPRIVYPAALIAGTSAAAEFLAYLRSQAARTVWEKFGFAVRP